MARYIDADKLKEDLKESESRLREIYSGLKFDDEKQICAGQITTFVECILRIKEAPTADVAEVKHGEWKLRPDGSGTCKRCGFTQKNVWDMDNWQNFCGHCGADMR